MTVPEAVSQSLRGCDRPPHPMAASRDLRRIHRFACDLAPCPRPRWLGLAGGSFVKRLLAALTLLACMLVPGAQGAAQDPDKLPTKLAPADHRKLGDLAGKWMEALRENEEADSAQKREKTRKSLQKARESFEKEWERLQKKANLLAEVGDMLAVFEGIFEYERQSGYGEIKTVKGKSDVPDYAVVVPKGYKAEVPLRALFVIPGRHASGDKWDDVQTHYKATWQGSPLLQDTLLVSTPIPDSIALDPVPDIDSDIHDEEERRRIATLFAPFGEAGRAYNLDRDRWILDCGRGASGFGLRLASYFPDRWGGIILRDPVEIGRIRLDNLIGIPVLILANEQNKAVAEKLATTLNGLQADSAKVIEGKGEYPYTESTPDIASWVEKARRRLFRPKVLLVPNHNQFTSAYWAKIDVMEPLERVTDKNRPSLIAEADRSANRINVTATGISQFRLFLNDALVDLDKEVTVVVNGIAETFKRERSREFMLDLMKQKFDPAFLFTTFYVTSVKKPTGESGSEEKKDG